MNSIYSGSKLKDVIKLSEPSDEQTTRHFECSLPSLAIAETHKEAQVIARREDVYDFQLTHFNVLF